MCLCDIKSFHKEKKDIFVWNRPEMTLLVTQ